MTSIKYATSLLQNQQGADHLADLNVDGIVYGCKKNKKEMNE